MFKKFLKWLNEPSKPYDLTIRKKLALELSNSIVTINDRKLSNEEIDEIINALRENDNSMGFGMVMPIEGSIQMGIKF